MTSDPNKTDVSTYILLALGAWWPDGEAKAMHLPPTLDF
jgi:hypothetical protein